MSGGFRMDDYVDVAQRIHDFYERFPDGSLQSGGTPYVMEIGGQPFIVYHALAYRTPDDPRPTHGWAWEPVPGPTNFTKDSELMNAETAAWGRAIVALGFATKKLASAQEVRNRSGSATKPAPKAEKETPADTKAADEKLLALVREKGGDAEAEAAALTTAKTEGKYVGYYANSLAYWEKQPKPFSVPPSARAADVAA